MTRIFATLALITAATVSHAGPAGLPDGTFDKGNCAAPVSDGRVTLRGNELNYYETSCTLSNPQGLRGLTGLVLVDAACSGEGEIWQTRLILAQADAGGLLILSDGSAQIYPRCK